MGSLDPRRKKNIFNMELRCNGQASQLRKGGRQESDACTTPSHRNLVDVWIESPSRSSALRFEITVLSRFFFLSSIFFLLYLIFTDLKQRGAKK